MRVIRGRGWKNDATLCTFRLVPPRPRGAHLRWRSYRSPFALSCRGVFMRVEYDPNKQGWAAAAVTTVATLGLLFTAYTIHKNTYRHPRDPMSFQVYHAEDNVKHSTAEPSAEAKH